MNWALLISMKITFTALLFAFIGALLFAWRVSHKYGKIEKILEWIFLAPIFFPPSALGYGTLMIMGKNGFIGEVLYRYFNQRIIFTWYAGVITTFLVIFPIIYKSIKNGFFSIDKSLKEASKELGASKIQSLFHIELPMIKNYIYSGIILAFGRGLGEFGAVIMVSGNIPKKTQTLPMALYSAVESGEYRESNEIMIVITIISLISIFTYNYFSKHD